MTWGELDLAEKKWLLPKERTKNKRPTRSALKRAMEIIGELPASKANRVRVLNDRQDRRKRLLALQGVDRRISPRNAKS